MPRRSLAASMGIKAESVPSTALRSIWRDFWCGCCRGRLRRRPDPAPVRHARHARIRWVIQTRLETAYVRHGLPEGHRLTTTRKPICDGRAHAGEASAQGSARCSRGASRRRGVRCTTSSVACVLSPQLCSVRARGSLPILRARRAAAAPAWGNAGSGRASSAKRARVAPRALQCGRSIA